MVEKQVDGIELEINEERAIYLANIDEMIFETLEGPTDEKIYCNEHAYNGVLLEIELI